MSFRHFWADKTSEQKRACVELLEEQLTRLEELAPDFKIASAVVHLDESSPHIHLVGVPVASGYKREPEKQAAKWKRKQKRLAEKWIKRKTNTDSFPSVNMAGA